MTRLSLWTGARARHGSYECASWLEHGSSWPVSHGCQPCLAPCPPLQPWAKGPPRRAATPLFQLLSSQRSSQCTRGGERGRLCGELTDGKAWRRRRRRGGCCCVVKFTARLGPVQLLLYIVVGDDGLKLFISIGHRAMLHTRTAQQANVSALSLSST